MRQAAVTNSDVTTLVMLGGKIGCTYWQTTKQRDFFKLEHLLTPTT